MSYAAYGRSAIFICALAARPLRASTPLMALMPIPLPPSIDHRDDAAALLVTTRRHADRGQNGTASADSNVCRSCYDMGAARESRALELPFGILSARELPAARAQCSCEWAPKFVPILVEVIYLSSFLAHGLGDCSFGAYVRLRRRSFSRLSDSNVSSLDFIVPAGSIYFSDTCSRSHPDSPRRLHTDDAVSAISGIDEWQHLSRGGSG